MILSRNSWSVCVHAQIGSEFIITPSSLACENYSLELCNVMFIFRSHLSFQRLSYVNVHTFSIRWLKIVFAVCEHSEQKFQLCHWVENAKNRKSAVPYTEVYGKILPDFAVISKPTMSWQFVLCSLINLHSFHSWLYFLKGIWERVSFNIAVLFSIFRFTVFYKWHILPIIFATLQLQSCFNKKQNKCQWLYALHSNFLCPDSMQWTLS